MAMTAGCCRYRQPSWSAAMGWSRRVSSIPIFAAAWRSTICSMHYGAPARTRNPPLSWTVARVQVLLPVRAAQHAHDGGCDRGAFAACDAGEMHGAPRVEPLVSRPFQGLRDRGGVGQHADADIGLEQFDQVALRGNLVAVIDVDAMLAQRVVQAATVLAISPRQQLLGAQIIESDVLAVRQPMPFADDEVKILGEQRPCIQPLPCLVDLGGDAELGFALLEKLADLVARAAEKAEFQPVELALDLVQKRNQQRQIDRMGQRNSQRTDLAALEG